MNSIMNSSLFFVTKNSECKGMCGKTDKGVEDAVEKSTERRIF